jgi:UDP-N-acetylglucosamine 2-epimerase (non-hydrolysing)
MKLLIVGGTRPNFVKISSICREFEKRNIEYISVHSGQHYDENISDVFFEDFGMKKPDWYMNIKPSSQTSQTANIMTSFETILLTEYPDLVIVVGDVTTTLACSLVVSKMHGIKLAHVEAGGRSFDKEMPEEINRIVTDVIADYHFAIEPDHVKNLLNEGISKDKVFLVGDNIIDNLLRTSSQIPDRKDSELYILTTIHRQSNTNNVENLKSILKALSVLTKSIRVRFPIHPRTKNIIIENNLEYLLKDVQVMNPLGYKDFVEQMKYASVMLTDSGGVTIEAAVLNIPCVVVRDTLERKFLIEEGMSYLVDNDTNKIVEEVELCLYRPPLSLGKKWSALLDGKASERIVDILVEEFK